MHRSKKEIVLDITTLSLVVTIVSVIVWVFARGMWIHFFGNESEKGIAGFVVLEPIFNFPIFFLSAIVTSSFLTLVLPTTGESKKVLIGSLSTMVITYLVLTFAPL